MGVEEKEIEHEFAVIFNGGEGRIIRNKVKKFRKQKGLTQKDLAKLLEVSRQTVISIEKERRDPSLELAFKISRFFEKPVRKVFELDTSHSNSRVMIND